MNKYAEHSKAGEAKRALFRKIHRPGYVNCIKKRTYESQNKAISWLSANGYPGAPYRCPFCHLWHVTVKRAK